MRYSSPYLSFSFFILSTITCGCPSGSIYGSLLPSSFLSSHTMESYCSWSLTCLKFDFLSTAQLTWSVPRLQVGLTQTLQVLELLGESQPWGNNQHLLHFFFSGKTCQHGSPQCCSCGASCLMRPMADALVGWSLPPHLDLLSLLFLWSEQGWNLYFFYRARWHMIHTFTVEHLVPVFIYHLSNALHHVCTAGTQSPQGYLTRAFWFVPDIPFFLPSIKVCWFITHHCASVYTYLMSYILLLIPFPTILCRIAYSIGSQNIILWLWASVSPRELLEMHILRPHLRPTDWETLGIDALCFSKPSKWSWSSLTFENHWNTWYPTAFT